MLRATTRRFQICERLLIRVSVMPSLKYSPSGSALSLAKGSTATDSIASWWRPRGAASTGAMKRYPLPEIVSMNAGDSRESRRACRTLRIAVLTPISTSTKTPGSHKRFAISARQTS